MATRCQHRREEVWGRSSLLCEWPDNPFASKMADTFDIRLKLTHFSGWCAAKCQTWRKLYNFTAGLLCRPSSCHHQPSTPSGPRSSSRRRWPCRFLKRGLADVILRGKAASSQRFLYRKITLDLVGRREERKGMERLSEKAAYGYRRKCCLGSWGDP